MGAGASGLMAAEKAARCLREQGKSGTVILLEGNPRPGKKLLATGNGRCNLTNLHISPEHYHGDVAAAEAVLTLWPAGQIMEEFGSLGLICTSDGEGRVYPNGLQAAAVLQALWSACEEAGVETAWGFEVSSITPEAGGFSLHSKNGEALFAEKCIMACGGMASPRHSCGEKGYGLVRSLGHTVTELSPVLTPLKTSSKLCRSLKGNRCKAKASLYRNGEKLGEEQGEVLFGDGQLSGICIFNLSSRLGKESENAEIRLDLLSRFSVQGITSYLKQLRKNRPALPAGELFSGALNLRIGQELVKSLGFSREMPIGELSAQQLKCAAEAAKELRFPIIGCGPWESAQVTAGGVPLSEIELPFMESKKRLGLYLTGELLNLHGDCGGYNLHWAWATGMAAGRSAAESCMGR